MSLRHTIQFGLAVLSLSWLCFAAPAAADDSKARARALFNQGVTEFEAGNPRAALQSFESAYRLAPHPAVRVNMANCFEQLGRFVEAKFNYERFLEESGDSVSPEQLSEVEVTLARLSAQIGTLIVSAQPANAVLRVDGVIPKRLPTGGVQLPTGRYEIALSADGFREAQRTIMIVGQEETRIDVRLEPEPNLDLVAAPLPEPAVADDEVRDEEEEAPPPEEQELAPAGKSRRTLIWVAAGATGSFAVGLAVTGGLSLAARQEFEEAVEASNDPRRAPAEREGLRADGIAAADRANRLALVSDIFLVSTVVAAGATLLIWLVDRKAEKRTAMRAAPMGLRERGGGGLVLGGKF